MTKKIKYLVRVSPEPSMDGRFEITVRPLDEDPFDISKLLERKVIAEKAFLADVLKTIEDRLSLKKSPKALGTLETIQVYETSLGIPVELVEDQFQGLMVESEDKEIIQKIYQELIKLQS